MPHASITPDPPAPGEGPSGFSISSGEADSMSGCRHLLRRLVWVLLVLELTGFFAAMLWSTGIFKNSPLVQRVEDASQARRLDFRLSSEESVSGVTLHVHGHLDGSAAVKIEGSQDFGILSGDVEYKYGQEWSSPACTVTYEPVSGTTGSLTFEVILE
jgi:hypothetical protein